MKAATRTTHRHTYPPRLHHRIKQQKSTIATSLIHHTPQLPYFFPCVAMCALFQCKNSDSNHPPTHLPTQAAQENKATKSTIATSLIHRMPQLPYFFSSLQLSPLDKENAPKKIAKRCLLAVRYPDFQKSRKSVCSLVVIQTIKKSRESPKLSEQSWGFRNVQKVGTKFVENFAHL
jgi:hypothetical protein